MNPLVDLFEKSLLNLRPGTCANRDDLVVGVATEASRRCRVCKKVFCCANCRESHQRKKHPNESNDCKLCRLEKLPLERYNSPEFLCHLVVRHLPLACTRCGDIFHTSRDLENVARCDHRSSRNSLVGKPVLQLYGTARTPLARNTLSCTDYDAVRRGYGEIDIQALENFHSPPELARNTSTPMHAGASSRACDTRFKTPVVPACLLKTPRTEQRKTVTPVVDGNTSLEQPTLDEFATTIYNSARSSGSESTATFYSILSGSRSSIGSGSTPSRSLIAMNKRQSDENGARYSREFYRANPGRMLEAMQEQEEHGSVDMELTGVRENLENEANLANVNSRGEAVKLDVDKDSSSKRVRFSDEHAPRNPVDVEEIIDPDEYYEAEETRENAENRVKENRETRRVETNENVVSAASVTASKTSRVLMMVVVEGGCERSSAELAPLITTGLRELERRRVTESSEVAAAAAAAACRSLQADVTIIKSVETYASTSTVEVYDTPSEISEAPANRSDSANSSGLFSAVAQVVRYALRGLQGSAREPGTRGNDDAERDRRGTSAIIDGSTMSRPGKRSRESANEPSPASTRLARVRSDAVHSPLAKRPRARGWYRIKAREPIARMRNASSATTRGVSSETQYFQQGSLSTADTVLPVPSRAHQFTQTE